MSLITLYHLNRSLPKRSSLAVIAVGIIARFGGLLSFMKYLLILVLFFSCNEPKAPKTGEIGIIKKGEELIRLDTASTDTNYLKSETLRPSEKGREYIKKLVIKYLTSKQ